jgi:hypothetical protein
MAGTSAICRPRFFEQTHLIQYKTECANDDLLCSDNIVMNMWIWICVEVPFLYGWN